MKYVLTFAICLFLGASMVVCRYVLQNLQKQKPVISPLTSSLFSLAQAPQKSLRANLTFSGDVDFQSRIATQSTKLINPLTIQQGESLQTNENTMAALVFPSIASIHMSQKSALNLVQTLPTNIVLSQTAGSATYTVLGTNPIAIKSFNLLIEETSGNMQITVDQDKQTVTIAVTNGTAKIAFNDLNYVSSVIELSAGKKYVFDNATRTFELLQ